MIAQVLTSMLLWMALCGTSTAVSATVASNRSNWYKKYPRYPPYCSIPNEMKTRSIPALKDDPKVGDTRLVQVTAVIRHGARTPTQLRHCWDGYLETFSTNTWDCDLKTYVATPSQNEISVLKDSASKNPDRLPLSILQKRYDALDDPHDSLSNVLPGTCQKGQLILQGYDQQISNGQILRRAYLYDGKAMDHDAKMRLIDLSSTTYVPYEEPQVQFRSDDDQRTVMSGQILLQGMFQPELAKAAKQQGTSPTLTVHLVDRERDILDPNEAICPQLVEIRTQIENSPEFQQFNQSQEALTLRKHMKDTLGTFDEHGMMDCMMTTICTDRPLPDSLNDYGRRSSNQTRRQLLTEGDEDNTNSRESTATSNSWFQRIVDFNTMRDGIVYRQNDAAYSKLALGPLWAEILENIVPIINGNQNDRPRPPPKFALFSGHDDTIMPLLATLGHNVWDGVSWPPYASMVVIEIHEIIDGKTDRSVFVSTHAFRLIYNGKVLTNRIQGCSSNSDLCDLQALLDRVQPFAKRDRNCKSKDAPNLAATRGSVVPTSSYPYSFMFLTGMILLSGMVGSIATFYILQRRLPFTRRHYERGGHVALTRLNGSNSYYSDEPGVLFGNDSESSKAEAAAIQATLP